MCLRKSGGASPAERGVARVSRLLQRVHHPLYPRGIGPLVVPAQIADIGVRRRHLGGDHATRRRMEFVGAGVLP